MQLAETLGITAEDVNPTVADTDSVGYTDVTGGSRVTFATGLAAIEAATRHPAADGRAGRPAVGSDASDQVRMPTGADRTRRKASDVQRAGRQAARDRRAGRRAHGTSSEATQGGASARTSSTSRSIPTRPRSRSSRYTVAQDAGTAIHPSYVEGQMQGGAVQGIGWALNEEYLFDDQGAMRNASYLDYRMPTCSTCR